MKTAIIGAGGFGREVLALMQSVNSVKQAFNIVGFIDDGIDLGTKIGAISVIGKVEDLAKLDVEAVVLAIGNSKVRERVAEKLPRNIQTPNVIHPSVILENATSIKLGKGCVICAGNILTTDITIGNFCVFNLSSTIGHDAEIADFVSIMPGVNVSGGAKIERGVYIGTGAKLIKSSIIGSYSTIGAGAVVDCDVETRTTVVGVPAKPLNKRNGGL